MSLTGRLVAITGPTAGIGRASALYLAAQGATLALLCRSTEKGDALATEIVAAGGNQPHVIHMDMARLASVLTSTSL